MTMCLSNKRATTYPVEHPESQGQSYKPWKPERWELTIESLPGKPDWPEPKYLLRQILKRLLRCYGFRCIEVRAKQ